ncbi:pectinesterase inhibitor 10-like [Sorghum bicolor]|uniref:pectinesterase inhibitor 10-like n=1 Tax=Sorghum bicolor TaxID=4558 RepID=UPI000B4263A0|nr:pectinesterase inhibitor 10-like [Sorghum bicolor]|eukprot:XP_021309016.1 pectinesterase inhibitor 10-like [Sorghum bicolor]
MGGGVFGAEREHPVSACLCCMKKASQATLRGCESERARSLPPPLSPPLFLSNSIIPPSAAPHPPSSSSSSAPPPACLFFTLRRPPIADGSLLATAVADPPVSVPPIPPARSSCTEALPSIGAAPPDRAGSGTDLARPARNSAIAASRPARRSSPPRARECG